MKRLISILISIMMMFLMMLCASCASFHNGMKGSMMDRAMGEEAGEAKKLIARGQYREAIDELSMLLELNSKDAASRFLRGLAYQKLEDYPSAVSDYQALLSLPLADPSLVAKAHYNLAMMDAFKLGEASQALRHFNQFLSLEIDHPQALQVAQIMMSLDHAEIDLDPNFQAMIDAAMHAGDDNATHKQLLLAAEAVPQSPIPYYLLAKSYAQLGERKKAEQYLQEGLTRRPTCAPCHALLADLLGSHDVAAARIHRQKARWFGGGITQALEK